MAINKKQQKFIDEFFVDFNATQAYIRAGYSPKGARQNASKLMANNDIRIAIQQRMEESRMGAAEVIKRLEAMAEGRIPTKIVERPSKTYGKPTKHREYDVLGAVDRMGKIYALFVDKQIVEHIDGLEIVDDAEDSPPEDPPPHSKQAEIESCTSKRILINAGRRAGKTYMVSRKAVREASKGARVLYIAPVVAQTDAFWEYIVDWLRPGISAGLIKKNEQKRTLIFKHSGGRIEARTGKKPDHLRGRWGDYVFMDEYAFQDSAVWEKVVAPMLADTDGTAIFISTPNTRNHFYHLYLKALEREDWEVFTFSSHDNPHLEEEALAKLTEDMTDVDYRQEILAEFVPGVGAVFILDRDDFMGAASGSHDSHRIVAGLDWGRKQDYTALSIGCADCQQELSIDRIKDFEYHIQRDFIATILQQYGNDVELLAEENAMGLPNIEEMRLDGFDVQGFVTSNASKAQIVQALRLAFTQHSWRWLDTPYALRELESFEMTVSPSGLARYGAPEGLNDDSVMARMLMLHQALTGRLQFY